MLLRAFGKRRTRRVPRVSVNEQRLRKARWGASFFGGIFGASGKGRIRRFPASHSLSSFLFTLEELLVGRVTH